MLEDLFYDFNWFGFIIAWVLLAFIPTVFLVFFDMGFFMRMLVLLVMTIITFFAVKSGGAKRGLFTR